MSMRNPEKSRTQTFLAAQTLFARSLDFLIPNSFSSLNAGRRTGARLLQRHDENPWCQSFYRSSAMCARCCCAVLIIPPGDDQRAILEPQLDSLGFAHVSCRNLLTEAYQYELHTHALGKLTAFPFSSFRRCHFSVIL